MSDDNSTAVEDQKKKRGRPGKGTEKNAVKEPKKRGRTTSDKNSTARKSDNEDDAPAVPAKRGRGRPKSSHKKKPAGKSSGRGRGRPKKVEEKPESTGEEEDEPEEEEEEN